MPFKDAVKTPNGIMCCIDKDNLQIFLGKNIKRAVIFLCLVYLGVLELGPVEPRDFF